MVARGRGSLIIVDVPHYMVRRTGLLLRLRFGLVLGFAGAKDSTNIARVRFAFGVVDLLLSFGEVCLHFLVWRIFASVRAIVRIAGMIAFMVIDLARFLASRLFLSSFGSIIQDSSFIFVLDCVPNLLRTWIEC